MGAYLGEMHVSVRNNFGGVRSRLSQRSLFVGDRQYRFHDVDDQQRNAFRYQPFDSLVP